MHVRSILFALTIAMVFSVLSTESSAQVRPLRWLGQGYGNGYNKCAPGPNPDYYNPYSAHNSRLISESYGHQASPMMGQQQLHTGVPFSVYSAPWSGNSGAAFKALPGQEIDNSFEVYKPGGASAKPTSDEPKSADPENTKQEDEDTSFYSPYSQGIQAVPVNRARAVGQRSVDFSKAGFSKPSQSLQVVEPLVDHIIESDANYFDPFKEEN